MKGDRLLFDCRPDRPETCSRCRGSGTVNKAYALAPSESVYGAPLDAVNAVVVGSFDIFTACKEALDIATSAGRPVAFDFLDHIVVVRSGDDPVAVARAWWADQYGETPEESLARR